MPPALPPLIIHDSAVPSAMLSSEQQQAQEELSSSLEPPFTQEHHQDGASELSTNRPAFDQNDGDNDTTHGHLCPSSNVAPSIPFGTAGTVSEKTGQGSGEGEGGGGGEQAQENKEDCGKDGDKNQIVGKRGRSLDLPDCCKLIEQKRRKRLDNMRSCLARLGPHAQCGTCDETMFHSRLWEMNEEYHLSCRCWNDAACCAAGYENAIRHEVEYARDKAKAKAIVEDPIPSDVPRYDLLTKMNHWECQNTHLFGDSGFEQRCRDGYARVRLELEQGCLGYGGPVRLDSTIADRGEKEKTPRPPSPVPPPSENAQDGMAPRSPPTPRPTSTTTTTTTQAMGYFASSHYL